MTPYGFAREECANFVASDNSCMGITVDSLDGSRFEAHPLTTCLLAGTPIQPCRYFERCILPLADAPSPAGKPHLQQERLEARRQYLALRKAEIPEMNLRTCPDCGAPVARRRRYCEKCGSRRRRESTRAAVARKRQNGGQGVSS